MDIFDFLGCEPAAAEMFLFSDRGLPWRRYVVERNRE